MSQTTLWRKEQSLLTKLTCLGSNFLFKSISTECVVFCAGLRLGFGLEREMAFLTSKSKKSKKPRFEGLKARKRKNGNRDIYI